jgi:hypothetical protein
MFAFVHRDAGFVANQSDALLTGSTASLGRAVVDRFLHLFGCLRNVGCRKIRDEEDCDDDWVLRGGDVLRHDLESNGVTKVKLVMNASWPINLLSDDPESRSAAEKPPATEEVQPQARLVCSKADGSLERTIKLLTMPDSGYRNWSNYGYVSIISG